MGSPNARLGDMTTGHDGFHPQPIISASGNVFVNGIPAARLSDAVAPHTRPDSPPHGGSISSGSGTVFINGLAAARIGDSISCGGTVAQGSGNVFTGG